MKKTFKDSVFSDETAEYRVPAEPERGDTVKIYIAMDTDKARRVMLVAGNSGISIPMTLVPVGGSNCCESTASCESNCCESTASCESNCCESTSSCGSMSHFGRYCAEIVCAGDRIQYHFEIETKDGQTYIYDKLGCREKTPVSQQQQLREFYFTPGFHVPEWAKGAVLYQIFPDRFRNGNRENDVQDNEYYYAVGHSRHLEWDEPVGDKDIRCFYGGDLQGVYEKLDYLQELGVEGIYLNPIFVSPSSHKYDVQDYEHVDPHLAVIEEDMDHAMEAWEQHNGYAPKYIKRVTSSKNLEKSDEFFAGLCREIHRRGMKIILDGVFNHCGSFNKWMDKEGIYVGKQEFPKGAFQSEDSPYRGYFRFTKENQDPESPYEGWWGYNTLPKLNYEESAELKEKIMEIGVKWASPPYSIDGWRLDVAADLGHSIDFNHRFWQEFRRRVKAVNPEILILAEHYGNPADWLSGDQWDTVMNYDAFMEPLSYFLTGMEKHSSEFRQDLYQNGRAFFDTMAGKMADMPAPSLYCAMNQLSNHDHSRFLTRTNRKPGRLDYSGAEAASAGTDKRVLMEAVTVQMTWPGAPTIYYGDEAGQVGFTDPDSRRPYPWGHEDTDLIDYHKQLTQLRKSHPALRSGSLKELFAGEGMISYARFNSSETLVICVNNTDSEQAFDLILPISHTFQWKNPVKSSFRCIFSTGNLPDNQETLRAVIPPETAAIFERTLR